MGHVRTVARPGSHGAQGVGFRCLVSPPTTGRSPLSLGPRRQLSGQLSCPSLCNFFVICTARPRCELSCCLPAALGLFNHRLAMVIGRILLSLESVREYIAGASISRAAAFF